MNKGRNTDKVLAQQLVAGIKKHLSNVSSVTFGGGTFTPAQVETSIQTLIDLRTAVEDAKTATQAKLAAESAQAAPLRSQMTALVAFVKATYGNFARRPRRLRPQAEEDADAADDRSEGHGSRKARSNARRAAHDGQQADEQTCEPMAAAAASSASLPVGSLQ